MARKAEVTVGFDVDGILSVHLRKVSENATRLDMLDPETKWSYEVKVMGTTLFKGSDLFTPTYVGYGAAAIDLLGCIVSLDGTVNSNFDPQSLNLKQLHWFTSTCRAYRPILTGDTRVFDLTLYPGVHLIDGRGGLVPFNEYGDPMDGSVLGEASDETKYLAEAVIGNGSNL